MFEIGEHLPALPRFATQRPHAPWFPGEHLAIRGRLACLPAMVYCVQPKCSSNGPAEAQVNQEDVAGNTRATPKLNAVKAKKCAPSATSTRPAIGRNLSDFVSALRELGMADVFGAAGRSKKQSMAAQVGTLGAGVTVGVGIGIGMGIFFAPRAGMETRAILQRAARRLLGLGDKHEEIQDRKPEPKATLQGDGHSIALPCEDDHCS